MLLFYTWLGISVGLWAGGSFICYALIVTAPIGALSSWYWARQQGAATTRCTLLGALYWAIGFLPWLYFAFQINGRAVPQRLMRTLWTVVFIAWILGPIGAGFFVAGSDTALVSDWFILVPFFNLAACVAALACTRFAKVLPAGHGRVHSCHVVPSLLGTLSMLSGFLLQYQL